MLVTILNFAMKKLNSDDSHVEAIGTMTSIFNYGRIWQQLYTKYRPLTILIFPQLSIERHSCVEQNAS